MAKKPERVGFRVSLDVPPGCTPAGLRRYVLDAVRTWCKSFSPDDPVFDLNARTVRVERLPDQPEEKP